MPAIGRLAAIAAAMAVAVLVGACSDGDDAGAGGDTVPVTVAGESAEGDAGDAGETAVAAPESVTTAPAVTADPTPPVWRLPPAAVPSVVPELEELLARFDGARLDQVVALGSATNPFVHVLGPAGVDGSMVAAADARFVTALWVVEVEFTSAGADAFDALAAANLGEQVAVVTGSLVTSAPVIQAAEFGGRAIVTGDLTQAEAAELAELITSAPEFLAMRPVIESFFVGTESAQRSALPLIEQLLAGFDLDG